MVDTCFAFEPRTGPRTLQAKKYSRDEQRFLKLLFERFFSQNTQVLVRKRDILYTSNKEIYTLTSSSEEESERERKREQREEGFVRFV